MLRKLVVLVLAVLLVTPAPAVAQGNRIQSFIRLPGTENTVPLGQPVLLVGGARSNTDEPVTGVELQFSDDPGTWHPAATRNAPETTWNLVHEFTTPGWVKVTARGRTATQVQSGPMNVLELWIGGGRLPRVDAYAYLTLHERGDTTENPVDDDPRPVELGLRFQVDRPGKIRKILSTNNFTAGVGARVGRLWTADGQLLAEAPENDQWWNPGFLLDGGAGIPVVPGVTYVASVYTPFGRYAVTENYFTTTFIQAPFTIEPDAGVYRYHDDGSSGVPSQTYAHSAYSVLPLFYS
ncbi:DUF4082 domain-containing protein [Actinokineospora globicatena]|uniref:DUF4082 domain-containing protein n=1 Tax=Actinokineospora globicatena TaxID=103729 RepID=A0A9W6QQG7_9PSEU|nr:DUF4082 domain-containing protein [Actinokineospora globicatena]GLW94658.1 hypothetical protein Aglo03_54740 [Actinokineospora globicatena]